MDPVDNIEWQKISETLERATDDCEDVAGILERIVLKNAWSGGLGPMMVRGG